MDRLQQRDDKAIAKGFVFQEEKNGATSTT